MRFRLPLNVSAFIHSARGAASSSDTDASNPLNLSYLTPYRSIPGGNAALRRQVMSVPSEFLSLSWLYQNPPFQVDSSGRVLSKALMYCFAVISSQYLPKPAYNIFLTLARFLQRNLAKPS